MTGKIKTGFVLSIIAHILSWGPFIYLCILLYQYYQLVEQGSSSVRFNYSFLGSTGSFAVCLGVAALILIGGRTDDPKIRPYKTWGRILSISAFAIVGIVVLIVVVAFLYSLAYIFGF